MKRMKTRLQITSSLSARHKLAIVALLATALSSCALLEPTDPKGEASPQAVDRSVRAVCAVDGPIALDRAIEIALANNPLIAAARHNTDAAGARHDIAFGAILPSVNFVGEYTRHLDGSRIGPPHYQGEPRYFSRDIFGSDIVLSMPLFTGGRLINEIRATKLLEAASEHQLARNREELVFNVSSVFYSILSQHHVIESLEFSQRTLEEHLKRVTELIQALKAARVEKLRTEVRIADLEQRLASERNVLAIQRRVLANLLGLCQEASAPLTIAGKLTNGETTSPDAQASLALALEQRGDYLAMQASLRAQANRVDAARAGHWPTVALKGSYGGRWGGDATDDPSGSKDYEDVGQLGIGVSIPLFAGGRISANVRQERAKLAAARETLRDLELRINLDVETAILNLASSLERVEATEKSIEQAEESLRIEREKYDFAKGSITDVLDAQSALLDSQMNYYRSLADYNTASAQYRLAVGEER